MKPRILVVGKNGQVSTYLQQSLAKQCELTVVGREVIDLSRPEQINAALDAFKIDLLINPAAYTAVDTAEGEADLAYTINRDAPAEIAKWCAVNDVPLIHFSTDYVFDGSAKLPYTEGDLPAPNGVYGASKLAGERAIQQTDANVLILRTSWVYSNHGKNFYKTMLSLAKSRDELSVVDDQVGSPTYAGSIAIACAELAMKIVEQPELAALHSGIYHFSCHGETSWHGFAQALFAENGIEHLTLHAVPSSEYPTPVKRPAYSVLSNAKLQSTFGISLPDWRLALMYCAREVAG